MKIPSQARSYGVQFNLTPMIDIVFLLIIFFLIASYLSSNENHDVVQLSPAIGGQLDEAEFARRIVVTVTADGKFLINGMPVTIAEFSTQLRPPGNTDAGNAEDRDLEVRLRVDKRVAYEVVEPLLVECAKAKISRIKFNVIPTPKP